MASILLDVLVVLVAAKLAAELAERARIPAVVGEIAAGVVVGPSVLGLVGPSDVLSTLGELGVILLLLEVGMSMSLGELAAVGPASVAVAVIGVVLPSAAGLGVTLGFGHPFDTALFVGAALCATSVGITARVFSDLRALGTIEARTVLGAAVADDVLGLVILTVVVRIATAGSFSAASALGVVAIAAVFLAGTTVLGQRLAPGLFALVDRRARAAGTMVVIALAFTLAFAELADAARLAPIVGAFVAGVSLSGSAQRDRIERELRPVGYLFVPVFFLGIGIEAKVGKFARPEVLGIAAALLAVAVVGKLAAGSGIAGAPGDKWLVGIGMVPRGEVGLIFASIGLQQHVLGRDLYAALLLVVLVSTLMTPPLLRWRLARLRGGRVGERGEEARPAGGWLSVRDGGVELAGRPPGHLALHLGLEAALEIVTARPGPALLDWLGGLGPELRARWDPDATRLLFRVLREGDSRSWRFLETSGLLERALPELAEAFARRRADPFVVDPAQVLRLPLVERLRELDASSGVVGAAARALQHPEWLLLAGLILDMAGGEAPVVIARRLVQRLDLGAAAEQEVALLVGESALMRGIAARVGGPDEEVVLQLAAHLDHPERARALGVLSAALGELAPWERDRLDELITLVLAALDRPELTGLDARNLVERRRHEAAALVGSDRRAAERISRAPRAYVLAQDTEDLARQATFVEPVPARGHARVATAALPGAGGFRVEVVSRDRPGLLARVAGVLAAFDLDVIDAVVTTWPDGAALESFRVRSRGGLAAAPDAGALERAVVASFEQPLVSSPDPDALVTFDDEGSPWYTLCAIRARDRPGLLHDLAAGLAAVGVSVHSARASTEGQAVADRFELGDAHGRKLDDATKAAARAAIAHGVALDDRRRRRGRRRARPVARR